MVGRTIGKYRIVEQIGRGGMGTVYKAVDETLDRKVAIKLLNADHIAQDAVERFRREAVTLAKLNHGRIGAIHELTRDGHDLLMVMEFLEGETFEKLIEREPLPVPHAVTLCAQVLDALQYAHAAGVVHRDLKPANVMVTPSGNVKVMDFGIARVQGSEHLTTNGYMVGTPAYMSPEQVRGEEVDPRMDLYSVAVVLYRLVTQHLPFTGDTAIAMIHSQLNNPPTPPQQFRPDIPAWLVAVIERGLAKKPADRFQTAADFRAALENGLTGKLPIPQADTAPAGSTDVEETIGPMVTPPAARIPPTATPPAASAPTPLQSVAAASTPSAVPAPMLQPQAAASSEATVTLQPKHLATAGALLAVIVIGVGVLAYVALRTPRTIVQTIAAPSPASAPAETVARAPAASESTAAVSTSQPTPAPAAGEPAAAQGPGQSGAVPSPAPGGADVRQALASSPPGPTTASPTPARPAPPVTAGAIGSDRPAAASARGRAGNTARGAAPAAAIPAEATPPVPAAALAPAENFGDIRTVVVEGTRTREVDALLSLEPGTLVVRSRADGAVLRSISYTSIAAATYARARRPRGQTLPGAISLPENVGGSGFLGGDRNWLTLQTASEFLIIRLEDRNMARVLSAVEARTGSRVVRSLSD
jgi:serine/threonine-protein kinase